MMPPLCDSARARLDNLRRDYPAVWQELESCQGGLTPRQWRDLLCVYAGLSCHDIPSLSVADMIRHVRITHTICETIPYAADIPQALYDSYLLPPRVNNEWPDGSRELLYRLLADAVRDLSPAQAALEVNYRCCALATYRSTDDRTVSPKGMLNRGFGRCGEESTLVVSALRAVGIPARQCYAPYWAHCDDNHAWVEYHTPEGWRFFGACEPEPRADQGWFLSAASKAMLIRSRVPDPAQPGAWRLVNTTGLYGQTVMLTVQVLSDGVPVEGAPVRFQLLNYSDLQTLHTCVTDASGRAFLETGLGDLVVSTTLEAVLVERTVDLRQCRQVILERSAGFSPDREEDLVCLTLTPPKELVPRPLPDDPAHEARLEQCRRRRHRRAAAFAHPDPRLAAAGGNREEIAAFLALPDYAREDKDALLATLTEKDLCDASCRVLDSFLAAALPHKARYPREVWQTRILAPRVEWEPLLPVRPALIRLLEAYTLTTPRQVLDWMAAEMTPMAEYGLTDRRGDAAAYVRCRRCPASEWHCTAVQICRALGIPAALDPRTGRLEPEQTAAFRLRLDTEEDFMTEREHFSLSRWNGSTYVPLNLGGCRVEGTMTLDLAPGAYRLSTVRRQIDGTVQARMHRFLLNRDRQFSLTPAPDDTAARLLHAPLPPLSLTPLTENAPGVSRLAETLPSLLIFLQPEAEPTEHLLREILDNREAFAAGGYPVRLLLPGEEIPHSKTLTEVLAALPRAAGYFCPRQLRYPVQAAAGIGDGRLPLALALYPDGTIAWGCANYQIRSAAALLRVLTLWEEGRP